MIEKAEICLNVLKYLQDWKTRENFASTCTSIHNLCLSEKKDIPPISIDLCSPTPITSFQSLTAKSLTLSSLETGKQTKSSNVSIIQIIGLLETMNRLEELTIVALFNHRGIRKLVSYLTVNRPNIDLFVLAASYKNFHKRLFNASATEHKITLNAIVSPCEETTSSSEEEEKRLIKRKYDAYEIPVEVENALIGMKEALMKSFVESGQAKLKKRRLSNPSFLKQLVKQNIVNKGSLYQPLSDNNFPSLDQTCFITKPVDIEVLNNTIRSIAAPFIESVICFDDYWLFVTQLDAFIRNDQDIDPCAHDTKLIAYPQTPCAKIFQKSFKRTRWNEMVILYGRLELLVTGGIHGDLKSNDINSFLGANLKFKKPINMDSRTNIYIFQPELSDNLIISEERLLQNYSRRGANYKWGFRSTRFSAKGFKTINPLYTNTTPMERAASLILKCLAHNKFTNRDRKQMMDDIHEASATYSIHVPRIQDDDLAYLELLKPKCNTKFNTVISAAKEMINGLSLLHNPQTVIDGKLATSLYNDVVKYRCNQINNAKVSNRAFLM